ncbi:MAG: acyltransferase [Clostridia bacterium]|nr:acyltransferase [Clostridia bacterium]
MKLIYYFKKFINIYSRRLWSPLNKLLLNLNGVKVGKGLSVRGMIYIFRHQAESRVKIGDNVSINSGAKTNPIGFGDRMRIQMVDSGILEIGSGCKISNAAITCANSVKLCDNVMLGAGVKIYDTDFHPLSYEDRIKPYSPDIPVKTAPIVIGEGAFIGAGSIILKGVTVGMHSIIGAGSVVTKDVPDYEIWGGNPAKFIRKTSDSEK